MESLAESAWNEWLNKATMLRLHRWDKSAQERSRCMQMGFSPDSALLRFQHERPEYGLYNSYNEWA